MKGQAAPKDSGEPPYKNSAWEENIDGQGVDEAALRDYLAGRLADYMLPSIFMLLDDMPLTPNGKIDRKALPEPAVRRMGEYVAPAGEAECAVAEAMKQVLGMDLAPGASDSFFGLGGDSIRAIRLVSLLREMGLRVSVADIMKQKTVRGIASCVESTGTAAISQEPYEGAVPDSAIVAFFKDMKLPCPGHYNQTRLLELRERAGRDSLQKAWNALVYQHDMLRAVFKDETLFVRSADTTIEVEEYTVRPDSSSDSSAETQETVKSSGSTGETQDEVKNSGSTAETQDAVKSSGSTGETQETVKNSESSGEKKESVTGSENSAENREAVTAICKMIQTGINMEEALMRIALIHGISHDYLYIAVHHLVIDGVSWRIILSDLETACRQVLKGEEIRLPSKTNTYRDYAEALLRYRDSYILSLEIPCWKAVQQKLTDLKTADGKDYKRSFERLSVTLSPEDTYRFLRADFGKLNTDINDALLTAVGRSFCDATGAADISVQFEGHGREETGENLSTDRTVGWFTSEYPVIVEGLNKDLRHDYLTAKEALHKVPNKGMGYNVLRFLDGGRPAGLDPALTAQVGFNYLGDMGVEETDGVHFFTDTDIPVGDDISPLNSYGPDIAINCYVQSGSFRLLMDFNKDLYEEGQARLFADGMPLERTLPPGEKRLSGSIRCFPCRKECC